MSEMTIKSKGQTTIPADIRKALGLEAGERVVFTHLDGCQALGLRQRSARPQTILHETAP